MKEEACSLTYCWWYRFPQCIEVDCSARVCGLPSALRSLSGGIKPITNICTLWASAGYGRVGRGGGGGEGGGQHLAATAGFGAGSLLCFRKEMVIKHWLQLSSNTIKGAFLQGPIHPDLLGVAAGHQRVPSRAGWAEPVMQTRGRDRA